MFFVLKCQTPIERADAITHMIIKLPYRFLKKFFRQTNDILRRVITVQIIRPVIINFQKSAGSQHISALE